jgi:hypothetical protein
MSKQINLSALLFTLLLTPIWLQAQESSAKSKETFFLCWGYNRSAYTTSDIHLVGQGYDFTLFDVRASDKPYPFDPKVYFSPTQLSIPQFNIRGGWQINKKWWLSLGYDHMKYVVNNNQFVRISGAIDSTASAQYAGTYNNETVLLKPDFLAFEHTDGLNFISTDIDYVQSIWKSNDERFSLEHRLGISMGILFPRTDVMIFDKRGPNIWNLAGIGAAVKSQLRLYFFNHFFLEGVAKAGRINMPKIQTTGVDGEFAQQKFSFIEGFWVVGYQFKL